MGFLDEIAQSVSAKDFPGQRAGEDLWREVFGGRSKEDLGKFPRVRLPTPTPGGSFGRSVTSSEASFRRLLQAMRSMAPGGWSDDRWEQTRHFVGIAYVAIHRICTQLQQSEFQVYKRDAGHQDGKRPITPDDPPEGGRKFVRPYDLVKLLEKPNNQDYFGKLMYRWGQQKYLTGSALTWMVPNLFGVPTEIYCIPTAIAIPQPAVNPDFPDGFYRIQPVYPYGPFSSYPTPSSAVGAPIPSQWMLRFSFPHPLLRYDGYSPLSGMRLTLDVIESIYRSRWYSMKRSINPSAVLNFDEMDGAMPLPEEEIERIRAEFEASHQGPENVGQLFVSTPGARIEPWGGSPKDMDYASGWEQETAFALAGFGITKPAAGMIEDASYATLFATLKQLYMLTLKPDIDDIAAELTRHLAPYFGDDLIVEIRMPRIDDHDIRNAKINIAMQAKAITKNQVLKELDFPITKEAWGNEIAGTEPQMAGEAGGLLGALGGGQMPPEVPPEVPPQAPPEQAQTHKEVMGQGATPDEQAIRQGEPNTGNLARGSLGPRIKKSIPESMFRHNRLIYNGKSTNGNGKHKSFYEEITEGLANYKSLSKNNDNSFYTEVMEALKNGN